MISKSLEWLANDRPGDCWVKKVCQFLFGITVASIFYALLAILF